MSNDASNMRLITSGRAYGIIAALALLAFFVVPPGMELHGTACNVWALAPSGCEAGVRGILRGAAIYCLVAGYIIGNILDRQPTVRRSVAPFIALAAISLFALPLWIGLRAAFW